MMPTGGSGPQSGWASGLEGDVLAVLAETGAITVRALREHLGVRRQRLLQVMARLRAAGAVVFRQERAPGRDGKVRSLTVYSVAQQAREPGSWRPQHDSGKRGQEKIQCADAVFNAGPSGFLEGRNVGKLKR